VRTAHPPQGLKLEKIVDDIITWSDIIIKNLPGGQPLHGGGSQQEPCPLCGDVHYYFKEKADKRLVSTMARACNKFQGAHHG
jgi:hypothetical protein